MDVADFKKAVKDGRYENSTAAKRGLGRVTGSADEKEKAKIWVDSQFGDAPVAKPAKEKKAAAAKEKPAKATRGRKARAGAPSEEKSSATTTTVARATTAQVDADSTLNQIMSALHIIEKMSSSGMGGTASGDLVQFINDRAALLAPKPVVIAHVEAETPATETNGKAELPPWIAAQASA